MNQERAISDVLQDILRNLQEIVRSEVRLAKAEIRDEARQDGGVGGLDRRGNHRRVERVGVSDCGRSPSRSRHGCRCGPPHYVVAVVLACAAGVLIASWHPESKANQSHAGANDRVDQGERCMDETSREIEAAHRPHPRTPRLTLDGAGTQG